MSDKTVAAIKKREEARQPQPKRTKKLKTETKSES